MCHYYTLRITVPCWLLWFICVIAWQDCWFLSPFGSLYNICLCTMKTGLHGGGIPVSSSSGAFGAHVLSSWCLQQNEYTSHFWVGCREGTEWMAIAFMFWECLGQISPVTKKGLLMGVLSDSFWLVGSIVSPDEKILFKLFLYIYTQIYMYYRCVYRRIINNMILYNFFSDILNAVPPSFLLLLYLFHSSTLIRPTHPFFFPFLLSGHLYPIIPFSIVSSTQV